MSDICEKREEKKQARGPALEPVYSRLRDKSCAAVVVQSRLVSLQTQTVDEAKQISSALKDLIQCVWPIITGECVQHGFLSKPGQSPSSSSFKSSHRAPRTSERAHHVNNKISLNHILGAVQMVYDGEIDPASRDLVVPHTPPRKEEKRREKKDATRSSRPYIASAGLENYAEQVQMLSLNTMAVSDHGHGWDRVIAKGTELIPDQAKRCESAMKGLREWYWPRADEGPAKGPWMHPMHRAYALRVLQDIKKTAEDNVLNTRVLPHKGGDGLYFRWFMDPNIPGRDDWRTLNEGQRQQWVDLLARTEHGFYPSGTPEERRAFDAWSRLVEAPPIHSHPLCQVAMSYKDGGKLDVSGGGDEEKFKSQCTAFSKLVDALWEKEKKRQPDVTDAQVEVTKRFVVNAVIASKYLLFHVCMMTQKLALSEFLLGLLDVRIRSLTGHQTAPMRGCGKADGEIKKSDDPHQRLYPGRDGEIAKEFYLTVWNEIAGQGQAIMHDIQVHAEKNPSRAIDMKDVKSVIRAHARRDDVTPFIGELYRDTLRAWFWILAQKDSGYQVSAADCAQIGLLNSAVVDDMEYVVREIIDSSSFAFQRVVIVDRLDERTKHATITRIVDALWTEAITPSVLDELDALTGSDPEIRAMAEGCGKGWWVLHDKMSAGARQDHLAIEGRAARSACRNFFIRPRPAAA